MAKKSSPTAFIVSMLLAFFCLFSQSLAAGTCNKSYKHEQKAGPLTDEFIISPFAMLVT